MWRSWRNPVAIQCGAQSAYGYLEMSQYNAANAAGSGGNQYRLTMKANNIQAAS
jgi:hypothetical protein